MASRGEGRRALRWIALVGVVGAVATSAAEPAASGFVLEEREDGVSIWFSPRGRSSLGTVKVSARFALPATALLAVLRDVASYSRWYRDCKELRVLRVPDKLEPLEIGLNGRFVRRPLDEHFLLMFVQHVPWLSDRFAVIENDSRIRNDGSLEVSFHSVDEDPHRGPEGSVRMRLGGYWLLTPLDLGHTEVTYVVDLDLDTSTPDFLVAPRVRDAAQGTLRALARVAAARTGASSKP